MAIYHASAKVVSRSAGQSATASAAYRGGCIIVDERTGEVFDYSRKQGVDHSEILKPENCGEWAEDRATLWNMVEQSEKRKDAQLAREFEIAIPVELSKEEGRALVRQFALDNFVSRGMIADLNIHEEKSHNPHAHILLTMREATPEGFGLKVRAWNDKELLQQWRENWAHECNKALERGGHESRVDHRSYADQGKEQEPTKHLGPTAAAMERRGLVSNRGRENRLIKVLNERLEAAKVALKEVNRQLIQLWMKGPAQAQEGGKESAGRRIPAAETSKGVSLKEFFNRSKQKQQEQQKEPQKEKRKDKGYER